MVFSRSLLCAVVLGRGHRSVPTNSFRDKRQREGELPEPPPPINSRAHPEPTLTCSRSPSKAVGNRGQQVQSRVFTEAIPLLLLPFTERVLGTGAWAGKSYTWCHPRLRPYLCEERYQALVVGELEVLGVKAMEGRNVTLNQIFLLIV